MKLLYKVLRKAIRAPEPPFDNIRPQKLNMQSRREFTVDEIINILKNAEGDIALLLGIGVFTGLRLGDCCTLKWSEIDLARQMIRRTLNKTGTPVLIGIHSLLMDRLENIPQEMRKGYLLPELAELYQNANTRPRITRKIQSHLRKCGIDTWKDGTGGGTGTRAIVEAGFHSLRHSYVSLLAAGGAPLALIQAQVGHTSAGMTNHYLHMNEAGARQLSNSLSLTDKQTPNSEPERERLAELARSADIKAVKKALKILENR